MKEINMPTNTPLSGLSIQSPTVQSSLEAPSTQGPQGPQNKAQEFWQNMYHIILRNLSQGGSDGQ